MKVFCINGENLEEFDAAYDSEKKVAVFETEHFSDWFVDVVESPSGSNGGGFPIWIVAVIVVIAALVTVVRTPSSSRDSCDITCSTVLLSLSDTSCRVHLPTLLELSTSIAMEPFERSFSSFRIP